MSRSSAWTTLRDRVVRAVRPDRSAELRQGEHVDPAAPGAPAPDPTVWDADLQAAWHSSEMDDFRSALRRDGRSVRESVVGDLATFYGLSDDEVVRRCIHWEELSVEEWQAEERKGEDGLLRFYRSTTSWSFDLLWYAYLQAEGHHRPVSVAALRWAEARTGGRRHLDFGSGIGATGGLFARRGWESTLADVSSTLLDFARFRLKGLEPSPRFVDLTAEDLPAGAYDVVTAIDALGHVPDIAAAARTLHRALAPGGYLLANIEVRPPSLENALHLHVDERRERYLLLRSGFRQVAMVGDLVAYQRIDGGGPAELLRRAGLWARLASPPGRWARTARRVVRGLR
ncbi:methyltransferase [Pseudonocardia sp.]|uniref:class I SAM-dependent methyltransferase n=1 Tax=Pseudonocardia sp. TaxID=60912 RepID=UPI002612743C|nr:methyltransferase [Pseudonocardia sp.]